MPARRRAYRRVYAACELLLCVRDYGAPCQEELEEWCRTKKVVNYQAYRRRFCW
jgi:hypothetical protein